MGGSCGLEEALAQQPAAQDHGALRRDREVGRRQHPTRAELVEGAPQPGRDVERPIAEEEEQSVSVVSAYAGSPGTTT
jgi:hypothetical protein